MARVEFHAEMVAFIENHYHTMTPQILAEELGVGVGTLRRFIDETPSLDIPRRHRGQRVSSALVMDKIKALGGIHELARHVVEHGHGVMAYCLGVHTTTLRRYLRRAGYNNLFDNVAKPQRNRKIVRMVGRGLTYSEVAAKLGVTRNTIAGVVSRHREQQLRKGIET